LKRKEEKRKKRGRSINITQEKNGTTTPEKKRSKLDSAIQAPPNKQAKLSNANLQETLLLSKQPKPSKRKRESKEDEDK